MDGGVGSLAYCGVWKLIWEIQVLSEEAYHSELRFKGLGTPNWSELEPFTQASFEMMGLVKLRGNKGPWTFIRSQKTQLTASYHSAVEP